MTTKQKITTSGIIPSMNLFPVVGVGASAGGMEAFKQLIVSIPENSGMAYVLVQHLDPSYESILTTLLQKVTRIPVLEISDDIKVEPNHIYVIPSNKMLVANDGILNLMPRENKKTLNLPIDLFFNSLAEVHQNRAIGVVLSGAGSDGSVGLRSIKDYGGITMVQDSQSAAFSSMPESAVKAGVADFILSPDKIPGKIAELLQSIDETEKTPEASINESVYKQILSLLRMRKGTDFTFYKQTTIRRRILRRMVIHKNEAAAAYLKFLEADEDEQDVLYQDLLIPVTSFFRDEKIFDNYAEPYSPNL